MIEVADAAGEQAHREALVVRLQELEAIRSEAVARAVLAVPRHVFAREVSLEDAYDPENAVVTKRDERGVAISSVSAPRIQAFMLEQADIRPGMRVLEIGSGGYNAALIAELVGADGQVTSMDIDPDVTGRARNLLDATGYERVNVVLADGEGGEPGHAPYDRIIVTVGAADVPSAWVDQLASAGRLVVPLRLRGLTRSVAFDRRDEHLVSCGYQLCGFVPMQGTGEDRERLVVLHDGDGEQVGLRLDGGQEVDEAAVRESFLGQYTEIWSDVMVGRGVSYADLDLWLATTSRDYALLATTKQARERGVVASWSPLGVSTLMDGATFAYLVIRAEDAERTRFEFGARAYGPDASQVAERMAAQIATWGSGHRGDHATIRVFRAGTPDGDLPAAAFRLDKRHSRITISWPPPAG